MEAGDPTFTRVEDAKSHAAYFCRLSGKQGDTYDLLLLNEKQAYMGSDLCNKNITSIVPDRTQHVLQAFAGERTPEQRKGTAASSLVYEFELRKGKGEETHPRVFLRWKPDAASPTFTLNFEVHVCADFPSSLSSFLADVVGAQLSSTDRCAALQAKNEQLKRELALCRQQLVTYADTDTQYRTEMAVKVAAILNVKKRRIRALEEQLAEQGEGPKSGSEAEQSEELPSEERIAPSDPESHSPSRDEGLE